MSLQINSRNSLTVSVYLALAFLISLIIGLAIACAGFCVMDEAVPSQADEAPDKQVAQKCM